MPFCRRLVPLRRGLGLRPPPHYALPRNYIAECPVASPIKIGRNYEENIEGYCELCSRRNSMLQWRHSMHYVDFSIRICSRRFQLFARKNKICANLDRGEGRGLPGIYRPGSVDCFYFAKRDLRSGTIVSTSAPEAFAAARTERLKEP